MATSQPKQAILLCLALGAVLLILHQWHQIRRLGEENTNLRTEVDHVSGLREEDQKFISNVEKGDELSRSEHDELLQRRAQLSQMKDLERENTRLRAERDRLVAASAQSPVQGNTDDEQTPEQKLLNSTRGLARDLGTALIVAAEANDYRVPGELSPQFLLAIDALSKASSSNVTADRFELVYKGSLLDVAGSVRTVLFREKEPAKLATGEWVRTYGFTDGHIETFKVLHPDDFARLEKQLQPEEQK
jgi:hypothetical protein